MRKINLLMLIVSFVTYNMAQEKFSSQMKSKFRPNPDWFANMNSQYANEFEQADQPLPPEESGSFQDFFVENMEPVEIEVKEGKFPRLASKQPIAFQNLCPYLNRTIKAKDFDPDFEYVPATYQEIKCAYPFHSSRFDHRKNRVCHAVHNFNCVQLYTSVFLLKRKHGTDCWEPEVRDNIPVDCSCMWSKDRHGDILHAHININDDQQ